MDTTVDSAALNTLFIELMRATNQGIDALLPFVNFLLVSLAIIAVVMTFALGTLREDFSPIPTLLSKLLFIGVIAWLIQNWRDLRLLFIEGAIQIGLLGGGSQGNASAILNPAEIMLKGGIGFFKVMNQIGQLAGFPSIFANADDILILFIAAVLILVAFIILSITVFVALAEFYIGTVVALVLIPFSIYRPMAFAAQSAIGYVMASGIKIIVLTIIIALADAAFLDRFTDLSDEPLPEGTAMGLGFLTLALSIVAWSASSMASGLIQGGPALGAGAVFGTAVTGTAAAVTAGAAAVGAGAALYYGARAVGGRIGGMGGGASSTGGSSTSPPRPTPSSGGNPLPSPNRGSLPPPGGPAGLLPGPSSPGSGGGGAGSAASGGASFAAAGSIGRPSSPPAGEQASAPSSGTSLGRVATAAGVTGATMATRSLAADRSFGGMRASDLDRE